MYDFALQFIREHDGPRVARSTARITLVDDARSTQAP
jgi:transcriptional regulator GlxA family with amidase domain